MNDDGLGELYEQPIYDYIDGICYELDAFNRPKKVENELKAREEALERLENESLLHDCQE